MPASPTTMTTDPRPEKASARRSLSCPISLSRPTKVPQATRPMEGAAGASAGAGPGVVAGEGGPTGERLVEAGPEAVEVASGVDLPAQGLLWGHVGHGSHHHAGLGHAGEVGGHRQAKVAQFGVALSAEPDVARLDVAVDDAPLVGVLAGLAD